MNPHGKMMTSTAPATAAITRRTPTRNETSSNPFVTPQTETEEFSKIRQASLSSSRSVSKAKLQHLFSVKMLNRRDRNPDHLALKKQLGEKLAATKCVSKYDITIWDESGDVRPTSIDVPTVLDVPNHNLNCLSVPSLVDETFVAEMDVSSLESDDSSHEFKVDCYDVDEWGVMKPDQTIVETSPKKTSKNNHNDTPHIMTPEGCIFEV